MSDMYDRKVSITVSKNGPYLVNGELPIAMQTITSNKEGSSWEWTEGEHFKGGAKCALCRCGASSSKPFCDGTHAKIRFNGTETADRGSYENRAKTMTGEALILKDDESLCAAARFCDSHGSVWNQIELEDSSELHVLLEHEVGHCPSGRLVLIDKRNGEAIEPKLPQSIGLVEDPVEECSGPLWVRGGVEVIAADGKVYEVRNRVTLCRCGVSQNKPFCDGSHASAKFDDGLQGKR